MSRLKQLIQEVHRRSLWQVLLVYVGASWVVLEAADVMVSRLALPEWVYGAAMVLLLVGLPIVLATAFVQEGISAATRHDPTLLPEAEPGSEATPGEVGGARRLFTWRNAIMGGLLAFSLWGVVATGWLFFGDKVGRGIVEAAAERKSVAVLPFANIGGDPENEYFSDGITGEIIAHLSKIADLKVISRTSVMQYKNTQKNVRQIGEELDVATILEGELQRAGDRIRINAQLIDAEGEGHLWSEQYDRDLTDIFAIQSDVAQRIAEALKATLTPSEEERIVLKPTDNLEAYDYYLRGNNYLLRSSREQSARSAIEMLEKAVELDPDFALAHAKLSQAHATMWWYFYDRSEARLASAKAAVDEAQRIDPDLPEAHQAMGWYHYWGFLDYNRALGEFAIARRGQPSDGRLYAGIGAVYRRQGNMERALENFAKSAELDPHGTGFANLALTYRLVRDYGEAVRYFDRALTMNPENARLSYGGKALTLLRLDGNTERGRLVLREAESVGITSPLTLARFDVLDGRYEEALARLDSVSNPFTSGQFAYVTKAQRYAEIYGLTGNPELERAYYDSARMDLEPMVEQQAEDARLHGALGIAYAGLGQKDDAIREGQLSVELLPVSKEAWRGVARVQDLARIYTMVGDYDAAIDRLEYLLSIPGDLSISLLRIDPTWDPLRSHPRFQALLEKYE